MSIPREFINLLLAKIDIVELIHAQIPLRKKSGSNYFACCPFHNEKSASFSVSQNKQFYYCFGCGAHGNAIDFTMQYDRLSFIEAIEMLAKQTGMEVPQTPAYKAKETSLLKLYDVTEWAAKHFYEQMCQSQRAIDYLKTRGISGKTAKDFLLGYAQNSFHQLSGQNNHVSVSVQNMIEVGLVIRKPEGGFYDRFRDRIMFPIHDYRGRIIGFGGRILDQGEPKYLNSPETPLFQKGHELYGLYHAVKKNRKLRQVLIVEGYMDVIALFEQGITYAVATLGTATTQHHIQRLLRYTSEIVFCFDGDTAGRTAAWRALQVVLPLMQDNLQVRFLFLPEGEDPDSLVKKEGKANFEKRIATAQALSAFFFQKIMTECDVETLEGRARYAALCLDHIKQLPIGLLQGMLIDELAKRTRIPISELKQQLPQTKSTPEPIPAKPVAKSKLLPPMRLAIALLLQQPELVKFVDDNLPPSDIPGFNFLQELISVIKQTAQPSTAVLLEHWRDQKEREFLAKLLHWEHMVPIEGLQNEFIGAMRQLTLLGFEQEINRLLTKAAQAELSNEDKAKLTTLINDKKLRFQINSEKI